MTLSHNDLTVVPAMFDWDCWITTPGGERLVAIGSLTVKQESYNP